MNEINCIFCDVGSDDVVIRENGFNGRKCPQCGLIYISPRPSFEEIIDLYGHDDAHISAQALVGASFRKRLFARHHLKLMRPFVSSGALMEIGAGGGYFLAESREMGFDPYGLEFNPIQAEFIRSEFGIPCEESPLSPSIFDGKKFDVVYHSDVLSHLYDPIAEFEKTNEIMKDGSYLVFETGGLADADKSYFKHFQRFQYPDHLFFLSADNLQDLLRRTGFEIQKTFRYSIFPQLLLAKAFSGTKRRLQRPRPEMTQTGQATKTPRAAAGRLPVRPAPRSSSRMRGTI